MTAYRKLGQYRARLGARGRLFRLGTNVCLDYVRSRAGRFARMRETLEDEVDGGTTASVPALGIVDRLDLERALGLLPVKARLVFILHDIEGLGHRDIAEMTGVAEGDVEVPTPQGAHATARGAPSGPPARPRHEHL